MKQQIISCYSISTFQLISAAHFATVRVYTTLRIVMSKESSSLYMRSFLRNTLPVVPLVSISILPEFWIQRTGKKHPDTQLDHPLNDYWVAIDTWLEARKEQAPVAVFHRCPGLY